ncbi:MAG: hypothetical protein RBU29_08955 [bacterium]|nr:hypothetical protein [bacterium]
MKQNRFRFCLLLSVFMLGNGNGAGAQIPIPSSFPPTGKIGDAELNEISGVVAAQGAGYWCHNDGGNAPVLYRVVDDGAVVQRVRLSPPTMDDWEALTTDGKGTLYLADVGDNETRRGQYAIHVVTEPETEAQEMSNIQTYPFVYPQGASYDCEALFWLQGRLYLIQKDYSGENAAVFCLDPLEENSITEARYVGELDVQQANRLGRIVTDAAYSANRGELAVLTYFGILLFAVRDEADLLHPPIHIVSAYFGQSEAICYAGDHLVILNETGDMWNYPISTYAPNPSITDWMQY